MCLLAVSDCLIIKHFVTLLARYFIVCCLLEAASSVVEFSPEKKAVRNNLLESRVQLKHIKPSGEAGSLVWGRDPKGDLGGPFVPQNIGSV